MKLYKIPSDVSAPRGQRAATLLGKQGVLKFSTPAGCFELTTVNPKLAKNVFLKIKCYCSDICFCSKAERQSIRNLPPNFTTCLPEISGTMHTLEISVKIALIPRLDDLWTTNNFQNLNQISIMVTNLKIYKGTDDVTPPGMGMLKFQLLPKLNLFSFKALDGSKRAISGWKSICQGLLNAAPNLEQFYLYENFCLDLTPCKKLKEFSHQYEESCDPFTFDFVELDIPEFTGMLEDCRNSLEKLTLNYVAENIKTMKVIVVVGVGGTA
ncbi:hypothetical protein Fcan01_11861 [Folsomia candida]|uniref:Uncharacterized protein n=1 Tax=Folsomia candida TaxID=158441 RepID=A0A226EE26_FOLCA|nr:hypothetical protein Fcan01_11861 [Folsomia candida]